MRERRGGSGDNRPCRSPVLVRDSWRCCAVALLLLGVGGNECGGNYERSSGFGCGCWSLSKGVDLIRFEGGGSGLSTRIMNHESCH